MTGRSFVWRPSEDLIARANLTRLRRQLGAQDYKELHRISVEEPDRFWPAVIADLGLEFSEPWHTVVDDSRGPEWAKWFIGGKLNLARICVHSTPAATKRRRRRLRGRDARVALLGGVLTSGDAARGSAPRARRPGARSRRHLHADVPGRRGRVARLRPHRRGAGADLLAASRPPRSHRGSRTRSRRS